MATKTAKRHTRSAPAKPAAPKSDGRFPKKVYERELFRLQGELASSKSGFEPKAHGS